MNAKTATQTKTLADFPQYAVALAKLREVEQQLAAAHAERVELVNAQLKPAADPSIARAERFLETGTVSDDAPDAGHKAALRALDEKLQLLKRAEQLARQRVQTAAAEASNVILAEIRPAWLEMQQSILDAMIGLANLETRRQLWADRMTDSGLVNVAGLPSVCRSDIAGRLDCVISDAARDGIAPTITLMRLP